MEASLYLHTICKNGTKTATKQEILEKCDERNDEWASQVRVGVCGAVSDLHAADARYHKSCCAIFMSPRSRSVAQREVMKTNHCRWS